MRSATEGQLARSQTVVKPASIRAASGDFRDLLPRIERRAGRNHAARRQYAAVRITAVRAHYRSSAPVR